MRATQLAAPGIAALALAVRPGDARADDAGIASASRPFLLGEVSIERTVESALRVGRFSCNGCFNDASFTLVAWEVSATLPLAERAAAFLLQPILFRGSGGGSESHQFPGALTVGVRQVGAVGPALAWAAAVSASFPFASGGGEAGATTDLAGNLVDDSSLYTSGLSTVRLELDARWQRSAMFAQAQLALAAHSDEDVLLGSSRGGLGAGVQLLGQAALLVELTAQLGAGRLTCDHCSGDGGWDGAGLPALSAGGRIALGSWRVGARGLLPLNDDAGQAFRPSLTVTAGARF
jgi:hypothetical protein